MKQFVTNIFSRPKPCQQSVDNFPDCTVPSKEEQAALLMTAIEQDARQEYWAKQQYERDCQLAEDQGIAREEKKVQVKKSLAAKSKNQGRSI